MSKPGTRRHYAYTVLTDAESELVKGLAARDGISVSDFVRRCINNTLAEEGDDVPLLKDRAPQGRRPGAARDPNGMFRTEGERD